MNRNLKYALCVGVFLLCVGIGFLITRLGKTDVSERATSSVSEKEVPARSVAVADSSETNVESSEVKEQLAPMKIISKNVKKTGTFYTLRIECSDIPKNVSIYYEIPELRRKSDNGVFTKIPGSKSGSYLVNVVNAQTKET